MDLNQYLDPVRLEKPGNYGVGYALFRDHLTIHTQNSTIKDKNFDIAIIGIPEDRNSINKGCALAPDKVRDKLYQLGRFNTSVKIADLGNLKTGHTVQDAYFALRDVTIDLLQNDVLPIFIGGSQDLTYGIYLAYKKLNKVASLVTIDSRLDIGESRKDFDSYTYLTKILFEKKKYLDNYTNLGHQGYFVPQKNLDLLNKLFYESLRIGHIRNDFSELEPILRDTDIVSVDISSVKQSEAPAHAFPTPNGFYSEEICQLARYAGISDKVSSFGIFEINPNYDINHLTSHLASQIIWLFIDGFCNRYKEKPGTKNNKIKKFIVDLDKLDKNIVFYKSVVSNRWWMEIPVIKGKKEDIKIISCSEKDYKMACNNELPTKWINAFQRID